MGPAGQFLGHGIQKRHSPFTIGGDHAIADTGERDFPALAGIGQVRNGPVPLGDGAIDGALQQQQDDERQRAAERSHQKRIEGPAFGDLGHSGLFVVLVREELCARRHQFGHLRLAAGRLDVECSAFDTALLADLSAGSQERDTLVG